MENRRNLFWIRLLCQGANLCNRRLLWLDPFEGERAQCVAGGNEVVQKLFKITEVTPDCSILQTDLGG